MGRDKLSLEINGLPLLLRVHGTLAALCDEVVLVGDGGTRPEGARRVAGERPGRQGPLAGIEAGLAAATHPLVFVAAGDMPFLTADVVGYLLGRLEETGALAVVPRHEGREHPLCAAYARVLLPRVGVALDGGGHSVRAFLEELEGVEYPEDGLWRFGDPDLFLMNVNSPEDLERARHEAGRRRGRL